jgi:outer membrane receptor for ferrienterochelin and colicins
MNKLLIACIAVLIANAAYSQNNFRVFIKNAETKEPLYKAIITISSLKKQTTTDSLGYATITNIPSGKHIISYSFIGFEERTDTILFPLAEIKQVLLQPTEEENEEVIVQSTRSSRTIKNLPTRVEVIDAEEVDEKNNMRPANVSMLLHESTGIQVQQTSATSANASIRIQGLDGRYTQILKDGFANFSGFASGLSVLEIPPVDLKQVEIIKGPSSTLYGGGAIAGVVNFISIKPTHEPITKLLLNQSNIGQTNFSVFTAQKKNKIGFTFLASANAQNPYDVDKDDFTELPKTKDVTITPRLFWYINDKATFNISHTITTAERKGGDIQVVNGKADALHTYFENNNTLRNTTNIEWEQKIGNHNKIIAKQSINFFNREIAVPTYSFKGRQLNLFTDVSYIHNGKQHTLITGVNVLHDKFNEDKTHSGVQRNNINTTIGLYVQHTWDASEKLSFENGLRIDATNKYGAFVLPKISMLYKINNAWSSRIGVGMGYKLPTLFTEETEAIQYQNVLLPTTAKAEKSYGGTADVNFKQKISPELDFSLNQMFFYTQIEKPLILQATTPTAYTFINATKNTLSYGFETNAKFIYKNVWKLFAGYTFTQTDATWKMGNTFLPLVPKSKLNLALIYEKENNLKAGLECYVTGKQFLSNGNTTPSFAELGFMTEKFFKHFSLFINLENFTDVRQSRYKPVVNGTHSNPNFDEIWTHTEGFVMNGGVKVRF